MRTLLRFVLAGLLVLPGSIYAQDTLQLSLGSDNVLGPKAAIQPFDPARGYVVTITDVNADRPSWRFSLGGTPLTRVPPTAADAPLIFTLGDGEVQLAPGMASVDLSFTDESTGPGRVSLEIDPLQIPLARGAAVEMPTTRPRQSDQRLVTARLRTNYDRRHNYVRLVFDANGLPVGSLPTDLDDNDVFNIVMLIPGEDDVDAYSVELVGDFAGDDFNVLASGVVENLRDRLGVLFGAEGETLEPHDMGTFGPFASGALEIAVKKSGQEIRRYKVKINANYLAALRFGVGRSTLRFNEFEVRRFSDAQGDSRRIINVADESGEPRIFLSVVFYAWRFWENRFWRGRDIEEPPALLDRINPFVAVGLQNFGEEYMVGLSAEVVRGLDFVWAVHIAQTDRLAGGFSEGQVFDGQPGDLPLKESWAVRGNFIGGSVDLRVAVSVLSTVLGGG